MQSFEKSMNEHTLYKDVNKDGEKLLVCIYVDDIVSMGSSLAMVDEFRSDMKKEFKMTDLGMLNYFLSLEVRQDELGIHVTQKKYV